MSKIFLLPRVLLTCSKLFSFAIYYLMVYNSSSLLVYFLTYIKQVFFSRNWLMRSYHLYLVEYRVSEMEYWLYLVGETRKCIFLK